VKQNTVYTDQLLRTLSLSSADTNPPNLGGHTQCAIVSGIVYGLPA